MDKKNHNIIIPSEKSYNDYLQSPDYKEDVNNLVVPDYIKKEAEYTQFQIVIDSKREVPFKMKKADSDDWYVGKCSRYNWNEKVSKYATQISWVKWIEMYTGLPVSKQIKNNISSAILGTGIFSITARTLSPVALETSDNIMTSSDGIIENGNLKTFKNITN